MLTALGQIYAVIQFAMELLNIWNGFLDYLEQQKIAVRAEKAIARERAINAGVAAQTDEEIWNAQIGVATNIPAP